MAAVHKTSMHFSELHQNDQARILTVERVTEATTRLQEMGLTVGTVFRVIKVAPFGDPIEIEFRGTRLCLRRAEASCFVLELVE